MDVCERRNGVLLGLGCLLADAPQSYEGCKAWCSRQDVGWDVPGATGVKCECEHGQYGCMSVHSLQEYVSVTTF